MKGNSKDVILYDITDAAIAEMKSIYMGLAITDLEDKEQFDAVHSARMTVKGKRVEVEKRRKELKADALAYGREVDGKAKDIFEKLEPIETHLDREEKKVTDEQKRIKEEADRKEREKIDARIAELAAYGLHLPFFEVASMDDESFTVSLNGAIRLHDIEQKRLAEEVAARKAESDRLEDLRIEMNEKQRVIDEANAKAAAEKASLEAEKKAFEDEKRKEQERINREAFEKQAVENARIAAEQAAKEKAEREAREAKEKADKEAAELARKEALKPDKEKLVDWGDSLLDLSAPELKDKNAALLARDTILEIYHIAHELHKHIEEL